MASFCNGNTCKYVHQLQLCEDHFNNSGRGQILAGTRGQPSCPATINDECVCASHWGDMWKGQLQGWVDIEGDFRGPWCVITNPGCATDLWGWGWSECTV